MISKICLCDWPYRYTGSTLLDTREICELAKRHKLAIELPPFEDLPYLKAQCIKVVNLLPKLSTGDPAFRIGLANSQQTVDEIVMPAYEEAIDAAALIGANVIIFTGVIHIVGELLGWRIRMAENLRRIADYAERKGVTLLLEHLNDKDDHPDSMLGHAGYLGCNLTEVAKMVTACNSPRVKLLFDVYHVALMHPGEHIALLRKYFNIIGHVHVAGVIGGKPSRVELDATGQQIDFKEVGSVLRELGYDGYIGLEYVVTPGRSAENGVAGALMALTV